MQLFKVVSKNLTPISYLLFIGIITTSCLPFATVNQKTSEPEPAARDEIGVNFVSVIDGKTISATYNNFPIILKAAAINVPVGAELYAEESRASLESCIKNNSGKQSAIRFKSYDSATRPSPSTEVRPDALDNVRPNDIVTSIIIIGGFVGIGRTDCNVNQIRKGMAKLNFAEANMLLTNFELKQYKDAESEAIKERLGVWKAN